MTEEPVEELEKEPVEESMTSSGNFTHHFLEDSVEYIPLLLLKKNPKDVNIFTGWNFELEISNVTTDCARKPSRTLNPSQHCPGTELHSFAYIYTLALTLFRTWGFLRDYHNC